MNVNSIVRTQQSITQYQNISTNTSTTINNEVGEAYSVNISDVGKDAQKFKGLSTEQVDSLKSNIAKSHELMIQTLTQNNAKLQGWLDDKVGKLNFNGVQIDTSRFGLPAVATTPKEAAKAIAPGGEWSVEAVSDRIFGLAHAIAGNDEDNLHKMQDAIDKGFKLAGFDFKKTFGQRDMPQITQDTHNEINKRFDELYKKLKEEPVDSSNMEV